MSAISQELILVDKFTKVFDDYIAKLEKISKQHQDFETKGKINDDVMKKMTSSLEGFTKTADKAVNGSVGKLLTTVVALGGAYFGISKLSDSIKSATQYSDDATRLANRYGGASLNGSTLQNQNNHQFYRQLTDSLNATMFQLGNKYSMTMSETSAMLWNLSKVSTAPGTIEKLIDLSSRLTAIKPGSSMSENAITIANMVQSRDISGLASQFGVDLRRIKTERNNFNLSLGRLHSELTSMDRHAQYAGATSGAEQRMFDDAGYKAKQLGVIFQNSLVYSAQLFVRAMEPAIEKMNQFFSSGRFINSMANGFTFLANTMTIVIDNIGAIGKALGVLVGVWAVLKVSIMAATAAQWAFNAAAMANPAAIKFMLVAGAIAVVISAIGIMTYNINKANNELGSMANILITVGQAAIFVYNTIASLMNIIITVVNFAVNLFDSLANFIFGFFDQTSRSIWQTWNDLFFSLYNVVEGFVVSVNTLLGGLLDGAVKGMEQFKNYMIGSFQANGKGETGYQPNYIDINKNRFNYWNHITYDTPYKMFQGIGNKYDELNNTNLLQNIANNTLRGADLLNNINYKWDPDAWMDAFREFTGDEMERQSVLRLNNNVSSPVINMTVNNNENSGVKMNAEDVKDMIVKVLVNEIATTSAAASNY